MTVVDILKESYNEGKTSYNRAIDIIKYNNINGFQKIDSITREEVAWEIRTGSKIGTGTIETYNWQI